jgi:hypothetical protein
MNTSDGCLDNMVQQQQPPLTCCAQQQIATGHAQARSQNKTRLQHMFRPINQVNRWELGNLISVITVDTD